MSTNGAPTAAAGMLVAARRHGRLTQAELARRAGLPRSVVNVYERGGREPGADTLLRLLRAAGVDVVARPHVQRPDPDRAARILEQVLDLAEALPTRRRPNRISARPFQRPAMAAAAATTP